MEADKGCGGLEALRWLLTDSVLKTISNPFSEVLLVILSELGHGLPSLEGGDSSTPNYRGTRDIFAGLDVYIAKHAPVVQNLFRQLADCRLCLLVPKCGGLCTTKWCETAQVKP